ncbi:hypothetical protein CSUI_009374 [Cystoisospora suis]|uniref:Uncharacterized protein n=1 Tax=Cystoisospora suis TaxID=483139 RepID=A0A2C6KI69_9APIC|nr:hypothetical protein CSUI_009374 [Cystoisospora suis]
MAFYYLVLRPLGAHTQGGNECFLFTEELLNLHSVILFPTPGEEFFLPRGEAKADHLRACPGQLAQLDTCFFDLSSLNDRHVKKEVNWSWSIYDAGKGGGRGRSTFRRTKLSLLLLNRRSQQRRYCSLHRPQGGQKALERKRKKAHE